MAQYNTPIPGTAVMKGLAPGGTFTAQGTLVVQGNVTQYGQTRLLILAGTSEDVPSLELSLYVAGANPEADAITEVSSPGYARVAVDWTVRADGALINAYDVVVGPVVGLTPYDGAAIGDGVGIWTYDDNVAGQIPDGQVLTFPAGTIVLQAP